MPLRVRLRELLFVPLCFIPLCFILLCFILLRLMTQEALIRRSTPRWTSRPKLTFGPAECGR